MLNERVDGYDVSHWNALNGAQLSSQLLIAKLTEGSGYIDPQGAAAIAAARRAAIRYIGGYHFIKRGDPDGQWQNFKTQLHVNGILENHGFYVFDWERATDGTFPEWATVKRLLELARNDYPGRGLVYCANWVQNFSTWFAQPSREPLWYSEFVYPAEMEMYDPPLWQFSDKGAAPGFNGNIDLNMIRNPAVMESICAYVTPNPATSPVQANEHRDTLNGPASLMPWDELHSLNGIWTCRMQDDGNIVVLVYNKPVWDSKTSGHPHASLQLQANGNLILAWQNQALWTSWAPTGANKLVMQNDGNLVTYDANSKATWSIWTGPLH